MWNILLVDDEPRHLEGLSRMMKRMRPHYAIHTAKNGKEALAICERKPIEIIITDVRMPISDGFEWIGRLLKARTPRKIIYLSGYDLFDYARQAMRLGAFDYLLKPLDPEKFMQVLEKAENSLREEIRAEQEHERMTAKLNKIIPVYQNRLLSDWIRSVPFSGERREELIETLGFSGDGQIVVVHFGLTEQWRETERETMQKSAAEIVRQVLDGHGNGVGFFPENDPDRLVVATDAVVDDPLLKTLMERLRPVAASDAKLTAGVSSRSSRLAEAACGLYREALLAAADGFYAPDREVFRFPETRIDPDLPVLPCDRDEAMLTDILYGSGDSGKICCVLNRMFDRWLTNERYPTPEKLIGYWQNRLLNLIRSIPFLSREAIGRLSARAETSLRHVNHVTQLHAAVLERLAEISGAIVHSRREQKETLIRKCLAYIDEHFMEDLSLESVASAFCFNPSYFSQYFKSRLNINFTQYLTQVRVNKAKEYLERSDEKIYQIASRVGYHDVKYFNRVFKKECGLTPEEYRLLVRRVKTT